MELFELNSHVKNCIWLCRATKYLKFGMFSKKYHLQYPFIIFIEMCFNIMSKSHVIDFGLG